MFNLISSYKYHWINSLDSDAEDCFLSGFRHITKNSRTMPVFLCVGTPLLSGDSLGPLVGSHLKQYGILDVYGTMDEPVHAENIEFYRNMIKEKYGRPTIITVDAAIGTKDQSGYITLRKGSLKPGSGIGKSIRPIGNIEITGILENISYSGSEALVLFMSKIITEGIFKTLK